MFNILRSTFSLTVQFIAGLICFFAMSDKSFAERLEGKNVAVALSAGFFGFYHQAGVLEALVSLGIRPARVAGNSAGALAAAMYASGLEPSDIKRELLGLTRNDFWDAQWPFTRLGFGFLAGRRFKSELARVLGRQSFESCSLPLAVGVFDLAAGRIRHISKGPLAPAVYASCALPYLFTPEEIDGRRYWDGGFYEKTPLVPFLDAPEVDTVLVSYLPQRDLRERAMLPFLPRSVSIFADVPAEERLERDKASMRRLEEEGKRVIVMAPKPLKLGPFSLDRAEAAYQRGLSGALAILESSDESLLGSEDLGRAEKKFPSDKF